MTQQRSESGVSPLYRKLGKIAHSKSKRGRAKFLLTFRLSGDFQKAVIAAGVRAQTVALWKRTDEKFMQQYEDIEAIWAAHVAGVLQSLDVAAAGAVKDAIEQTEDKKLRTETALRLLRSHGHLPDKPAEEQASDSGLLTGEAVEVIRKTFTIEETRILLQKAREQPIVLEAGK